MKISAAYKGVITGVLMIATALVAYLVLKLPVNQKEQYVLYTIFTAGIVWSLISEKNNKQVVSFKDFFGIGFRTYLIATLLIVVFTYIYFKLDTNFIENFIKENNKMILLEGKKTPIEIEDNEKLVRKTFVTSKVLGATIFYLFIGALVSLVGAGFLSQQKAKG